MGDSMVRETLRSLCCNNGWSYGVFWRFDQKNSLLSLQDLYSEQEVNDVIEDILMQVHFVGQGVIGRAASSKRHRWIGEMSHAGIIQDADVFQDLLEFHQQFSANIKTIAVIPVHLFGVVQFGSTQKLVERLDFVSLTRELFQSIQILEGLSSSMNEPVSSTFDSWDANELVASLVSSQNFQFMSPELSFQHSDSLQGYVKTDCSLANMTESIVSTLEHQETIPLVAASSSQSENRFRISSAEAQVKQNYSGTGGFIEPSASRYPQSSEIINSLGQKSAPLNPICSTDLISENIQSFDELFGRGSDLCTIDELSRTDFSKAASRPCADADFFQWFSSMAEPSNEAMVLPSASESVPLVTNPRRDDQAPSVSVQSTVTKAICSDAVGIGKQFPYSGCISRQFVDSNPGTSNTLFSRLGLHQKLDEIERGSKRRKMDCSLLGSNEVSCLPQLVGNLSSAQTAYHLNSSKNFDTRDKDVSNFEAGSCIVDSCGITKTVSSSKKVELPPKSMKKKAKPGSKPRPKDRQQIHDRLIELRGLIPNGEKMSIDRLLHLTIKHLIFLQGVARHAEMFHPTEETKNREILKGNQSDNAGVTWACEVGDQKVIYPLIIEDLDVPGHMLIEILCEEHGFFLEIVDVIRGFGLIILKGVMELRETKIWARFNVVAEESSMRRVTRQEIFTSLVQLLNLTGPTGSCKSEPLGMGHMAMSGNDNAALFNSCQPATVPRPVSLALR